MVSSARPRSRLSLGSFNGYVASALALTALFALAWSLRAILLLAFGSIVIAAVIRAFGRPVIRRYPQHEALGVLAAILVLLLLLGGVFWLFGQQISEQMRGLGQRLPGAAAAVRDWAEQSATGRFVLEKLQNGAEADTGGTIDGLKQAITLTVESVSRVLLMLVAGIYFAFDPRLYVSGFTRLFPPVHRARVRDALETSGETLQRWLLGQLVSMVAIGTLTAAGLALVRCPVPLALGLLAGLFAFVPVIGFLAAFIPMALIALSESPEVAVAAIVVFLVVQQIEEQVVQPLAQKWATSLPPALGLLALAAAGALFGLSGLIFGAPLTVVIICLVKQLYLEDSLEKPAA